MIFAVNLSQTVVSNFQIEHTGGGEWGKEGNKKGECSIL